MKMDSMGKPSTTICGIQKLHGFRSRLFPALILVTTCFSTITCITIPKLASRSFPNMWHSRTERSILFSRDSTSSDNCCRWTSGMSVLYSKGFSKADFMDEKAKHGSNKKEKRKKNLLTNNDVFSTTNNKISEPPKLDRFGLPIPTENDLFPPMPPGTEIIPALPGKQITTQEEMDTILCNHAITLDLSALEKMSRASHNESPMKLRLLHQSPPVLAVDNFFTKEECQYCLDLVQSSSDGNNDDAVEVRSATFSSSLAQSKRTSTTWYVKYRAVTTFLAKLTGLLSNISLDQCEEAQIVRYRTGEEFSWHYDEVPSSQLENGGQRIATALVYLNDVDDGGGTVFRDLLTGTTDRRQQQLSMQPRQGSLLLFFPAFADGLPDERTLHKGEKVASGTKMIAQMWIHQRQYLPVLPKGNSHEDAREAIQAKKLVLGLTAITPQSHLQQG